MTTHLHTFIYQQQHPTTFSGLFTTPPHSKIIDPNQTDSDTDFRHTITSTYDARTLVLFNSKIIHPKQSDSNTSSSIQQAHFYHLRQGVTYPKQWVQQRLLADSLMRDNYTKSTASVRSYGALVKWEDSQYNNPTLDFNHMSIYNLKDTHHKN